MAGAPPERARASLQASHAQGQPFTLAWAEAWRAALEDVNDYQRTNWIEALAWSRPFFQAAYLGDPGWRCGRTLDQLE